MKQLRKVLSLCVVLALLGTVLVPGAVSVQSRSPLVGADDPGGPVGSVKHWVSGRRVAAPYARLNRYPGAQAAKAKIRVAFIDSGISTKHISAAKVAEGRNYVFPEADTEDRIGHGTATAGLVLGAADQGVSGVCPDAIAVPLVVVDAYPSGAVKNGGPEALCEAIYDAVDLFDCQIINISLCTTENSAELRAAADYAEAQGVVVIAAVGNDGENGQTYYPSAYETVVSVGSADGTAAAAFSQRGADLLAEGTDLLTATNKNANAPTTVQGTSYSCALVSGVCARLLVQHPKLTPLRVRSVLYALAEDVLDPGFDYDSGWGLLHADLKIPASKLPELSAAKLRRAARIKARAEAMTRLRALFGEAEAPAPSPLMRTAVLPMVQ